MLDGDASVFGAASFKSHGNGEHDRAQLVLRIRLKQFYSAFQFLDPHLGFFSTGVCGRRRFFRS